MDIHHLVKMANEIGAFFRGEAGSPEEAARLVANHFRRFWDPRMRREIVAHLDAGGEGLDEIAHRAVALLGREAGTAR